MAKAHDHVTRKSGAPRAPGSGGNLAAVAKARQRRHTLIGALLITLLLTLALAVFLLDPVVAALRDDRMVVAVMRSAPGIVPGAPVWIAGHPVGTVSSLEFMPVRGSDSDPRIAVTLSVPTEHAALIRHDARVRITSDGLVGEPVIDVEPGTAGAPALAPGDTLYMTEPRSGANLMAEALSLRLAIDSLMAAAAPVSERAAARMDELARIQTRFAGSQAELARLSEAIASSAARDFADDASLARAIARLRSAAADASAHAADGGGAARMQAALAPLAAHANALNAQLAALRMNGENGTFARLQNDSALAVAVRRTQAQLDSLIAEVTRNPLRFVF